MKSKLLRLILSLLRSAFLAGGAYILLASVGVIHRAFGFDLKVYEISVYALAGLLFASDVVRGLTSRSWTPSAALLLSRLGLAIVASSFIQGFGSLMRQIAAEPGTASFRAFLPYSDHVARLSGLCFVTIFLAAAYRATNPWLTRFRQPTEEPPQPYEPQDLVRTLLKSSQLWGLGFLFFHPQGFVTIWTNVDAGYLQVPSYAFGAGCLLADAVATYGLGLWRYVVAIAVKGATLIFSLFTLFAGVGMFLTEIGPQGSPLEAFLVPLKPVGYWLMAYAAVVTVFNAAIVYWNRPQHAWVYSRLGTFASASVRALTASTLLVVFSYLLLSPNGWVMAAFKLDLSFLAVSLYALAASILASGLLALAAGGQLGLALSRLLYWGGLTQFAYFFFHNLPRVGTLLTMSASYGQSGRLVMPYLLIIGRLDLWAAVFFGLLGVYSAGVAYMKSPAYRAIRLSLTAIIIVLSVGTTWGAYNTLQHIGDLRSEIEVSEPSNPLYGTRVEVPSGVRSLPAQLNIYALDREVLEEKLNMAFEGSNLRLIKAIRLETAQTSDERLRISFPFPDPNSEGVALVARVLSMSSLASSKQDVVSSHQADSNQVLVLVDIAEVEGGHLVTHSAQPFPGITSSGDYLFLIPASKTFFVKGTALDESGNAVPDALVASVQSSGMYSLSQADGAFVVNVNDDNIQATTLIGVNIDTGLLAYRKVQTMKQVSWSVGPLGSASGHGVRDTGALVFNRSAYSNDEIQSILSDSARDIAENPWPTFVKAVRNVAGALLRPLEAEIMDRIVAAFRNAPRVDFVPSNAEVCTEEEVTFRADIGYYYNEDLGVGLKVPASEMEFNPFDIGLGVFPRFQARIRASIGLEFLKIAHMGIRVLTTDPNIATVTDTHGESNYYVVNVRGQAEGTTELKGLVIKVSELTVGVSLGYSLTEEGLPRQWHPSMGLIKVNIWPFVRNLGFENRLGPAIVKVVEFRVLNESPQGNISLKRPTISADLKPCSGAGITASTVSSIFMTLDDAVVVPTTSLIDHAVRLWFTPADDLSEGIHKVAVYAKDNNENMIKRTEWVFRVGECLNLAGDWEAIETIDYIATIAGETETGSREASGIITINQNGCNISLVGPAGLVRSGTVKGNMVELSGELALPLAGTATFTQNTISFIGDASENVTELRIYGTATGTLRAGEFSAPFSATITGTLILKR